MDMRDLARQTIVLNKAAIDNGFNTMMILRVQMEIMTDTFLNQIPGFPPAGKKAIDDWAAMYRNGCDQLRKTMVDSMDLFEGCF